jgi:hypothetical protein
MGSMSVEEGRRKRGPEASWRMTCGGPLGLVRVQCVIGLAGVFISTVIPSLRSGHDRTHE